MDLLLCRDASTCTALSPRAERLSPHGCPILTLARNFQVCLHCLCHYSFNAHLWCIAWRRSLPSAAIYTTSRYVLTHAYMESIASYSLGDKYCKRCALVPRMHWPQRRTVCHFILTELHTTVFFSRPASRASPHGVDAAWSGRSAECQGNIECRVGIVCMCIMNYS